MRVVILVLCVHCEPQDMKSLTAITEILPRADDKKVIKIALERKSVLITEDKDFGQLVYAFGYGSVGVLLLRYPASARKRLLKDILKFVQQQQDKLIECFAVLQPGRVRIGRVPGVAGNVKGQRLLFCKCPKG